MTDAKKEQAPPNTIVHPVWKLLGILVLLAYEDSVIIFWPKGPMADMAAFAVILAADIAIGFDVFIRPSTLGGQRDEYNTMKIYLFFVASPLLLGAPWAERALLARLYQSALVLDILYIIGFAMTLAGGLLLAWGRLSLGRFGSPKVIIQDDHRLIMTGPYRWLRNPMYSADLLLYAGLSIALGAWASAIIVTASLLPILLGRIRLEEKLLEDRFDGEYYEWAKRTWRLVPFIW